MNNLVPRSSSETVDQSGATAGGNIVGGNLTHNVYQGVVPKAGIVDQLIEKLKDEIGKNEKTRDTIEALQYFRIRKSIDGIDGLEAKLKKGGREHELYLALEKKENFAKLLEKWSFYASAQEIFAVLLANVEHEFNYAIYPSIKLLSEVEINQLVTEKIVSPTISACGTSVFVLNHTIVMGMVYWLAEQCFIRWHQ